MDRTQARREMKRRGRANAKTHYAVFTFVCIIAAFLKVDDSFSFEFLTIGSDQIAAITNLIQGMGRSGFRANSRGVLASVVNRVSGNSLSTLITDALHSVAGASQAWDVVGIVANAIVALFLWIFVVNVFRVIMRRMFLEGRTYKKVEMNRLGFLWQVRRWTRASLGMLRMTVQHLLWSLTLVGVPVKYYAYFLVPFILAENPNLTGGEAILLSRRMMDGHKWECFLLDLTLLPWYLLSGVTLGLSDVIFGANYRMSVYTEFYVARRAEARAAGLENADVLFDTYLYEQADASELTAAYPVAAEKIEVPERHYRNGVERFFCETFGLTFWPSEQDMEIERAQTKILANRHAVACGRGEAYPMCLYPLPVRQEREHESRLYTRRYSLFSLVLIFFCFAIVGWMWEVGLHLVTEGRFVNRGVMHGPWLPIYGAGGALALVSLYRFRKWPVLEFLLTVVLCGLVEYFTAYYLEMTHGGQRWWDYGGYFLNIGGRVCAEGLLIFGMGGMFAVYFAAPILDNLIRRLRRGALVALCVALLLCYGADQIYSSAHPNAGAGITDYAESNLGESTPVTEDEAA